MANSPDGNMIMVEKYVGREHATMSQLVLEHGWGNMCTSINHCFMFALVELIKNGIITIFLIMLLLSFPA